MMDGLGMTMRLGVRDECTVVVWQKCTGTAHIPRAFMDFPRGLQKYQRPSLHGENPTVPRKIIGTLTLSNSSAYTSIIPIGVYKAYTMPTPKHLGPFLLRN